MQQMGRRVQLSLMHKKHEEQSFHAAVVLGFRVHPKPKEGVIFFKRKPKKI